MVIRGDMTSSSCLLHVHTEAYSEEIQIIEAEIAAPKMVCTNRLQDVIVINKQKSRIPTVHTIEIGKKTPLT